MNFSLLFSLVIAVAVLPISNAQWWLEIDAFAHHSSCTSGSYWTWQATEHQCVTFYDGFGYSVRFDWNLPNDYKGQVYAGGTCTSWLGTVYGNGIHSPCWKGFGTRAAQANWFWDPFLTAEETEAGASSNSARAIESRHARDNATKECNNPVAPVSFTYLTPDGGERKIKIPTDEGAADRVAALYAASDFEALAEYAELPPRAAK